MMGFVTEKRTGMAFEAFCPALFPGGYPYSHGWLHQTVASRVRIRMENCLEGNAVVGEKGDGTVEAAQYL